MALSTPIHDPRRDPPSEGSPHAGSASPNGTPGADGAHNGPVGSASTPELIGRLVNDLSNLVDKQIELAKQEIRETIGDATGAIKQLAIGAGITAAAGLLLLITAWTAFIWFFNWLGYLLLNLTGVSWLAAIGGLLGWLLGFIVPAVAAYFFAWKRYLKSGLDEGTTLMRNPMGRTRTTLKEDLEWLRKLRSPSTK